MYVSSGPLPLVRPVNLEFSKPGDFGFSRKKDNQKRKSPGDTKRVNSSALFRITHFSQPSYVHMYYANDHIAILNHVLLYINHLFIWFHIHFFTYMTEDGTTEHHLCGYNYSFRLWLPFF